MPTFLVFQATYTSIEVALYRDGAGLHAQKTARPELVEGCEREKCVLVPKHDACAQLMGVIQSLLQSNNLSWQDLSFIGANQGPAPFTTLRVLIATINGIGFATQIPLVGVDGLKVFFESIATQVLLKDSLPARPECFPVGEKYRGIELPIILLNAFNNDVYFAYQENNQLITGCAPITNLLTKLREQPKNYIFTGQGAQLHQKLIQQELSTQAMFLEPVLDFTPLDAVARASIQSFQAGRTSNQLLPLYLKSAVTNN